MSSARLSEVTFDLGGPADHTHAVEATEIPRPKNGTPGSIAVLSARVIVLGNGQRVGLGAYVAGIKACAAAPAGTEYRHGLTGDFGATRERILSDWRASVHDRINRHAPDYGRGRKWSHDWQRDAGHAARDLNRPRLRIYWLPSWLRERFAHRIAERGE